MTQFNKILSNLSIVGSDTVLDKLLNYKDVSCFPISKLLGGTALKDHY